MQEKLSREEEAVVEKMYEELCGDIRRERRRIGGDWVVAGVIQTRQHRDLIRSEGRQGSSRHDVILHHSGSSWDLTW